MTENRTPVGAILILGGARSGKSRRAQAIAEASGLRPILIATATAGDAEMAERIARHRAERGPAWATVEEPRELGVALRREARPDRIVVVDCATLWLANRMFVDADLAAVLRALAETLAALTMPCIVVSNEVGFGVVPETAMGRRFRDAQGWLNQELVAVCERVELVVAGIPLVIKPRA